MIPIYPTLAKDSGKAADDALWAKVQIVSRVGCELDTTKVPNPPPGGPVSIFAGRLHAEF